MPAIALVATLLIASAPDTVVGSWEMCYEPGLPGVHVVDRGRLVLHADGTYFKETRSGCTPREPPTAKQGPYFVTDAGVTLIVQRSADVVARGHDEWYAWHLRSLPVQDVEYADGRCGRADVLTPGTDASYGFARGCTGTLSGLPPFGDAGH